MDRSFRDMPSGSTPWTYTSEADRLARPDILVVEDDPDIRDMLRTLLDLAGFGCVACATAEAGLEALREESFDFVLTDYALPERTGLWLLDTARSEGLLDGVPALIVTAHPSLAGAGGYEVMHKPFDLDDLVNRVRQRMDANRSGRRRLAASAPDGSDDGVGNGGAAGDGGGPRADRESCPDPVELILYVSAYSPHSAAAVRNIENALSRFKSNTVRLTVRDLTKNPSSGDADNIAFTPTLVRRTPGPRTFILGHLSNPDLVLELLADCNLEESNALGAKSGSTPRRLDD